MVSLSEKVLKLGESETLLMSKKTLELKAQGIDVINLSLGEPDFFTPDFIKEAAKNAIDENCSFYTPVAGRLDLRKAISDKLKRENNLTLSAEQIVVSTGAKQCIANLLLALINPGDEVMLPAPYWVSYKDMVEFVGGVPVIIPSSSAQNYKITAEQIKAHLTNKTKVFLFSNPNNPSGAVLKKNELQDIASVLAAFPQVIVISDEIYEYITFCEDVCSIGVFPEVKDRTVVVNGLSKGFAMTGWRLGYLAGPIQISKACDKIQSQFTSGTNSVTQKAAIVALQAGSSHHSVKKMKEAFLQRRNFLHAKLCKIPHLKVPLPEGAFYLLPDFEHYLKTSRIKTSKELAMYLLHEAHVGLTPGEAFGAPNAIRFSYAIGEDRLEVAANRIQAALEKL